VGHRTWQIPGLPPSHDVDRACCIARRRSEIARCSSTPSPHPRGFSSCASRLIFFWLLSPAGWCTHRDYLSFTGATYFCFSSWHAVGYLPTRDPPKLSLHPIPHPHVPFAGGHSFSCGFVSDRPMNSAASALTDRDSHGPIRVPPCLFPVSYWQRSCRAHHLSHHPTAHGNELTPRLPPDNVLFHTHAQTHATPNRPSARHRRHSRDSQCTPPPRPHPFHLLPCLSSPHCFHGF